MKQVYQLFAAATIVVVGATNLAARNWTPSTSAVPAAEVKAGQTYALQGLSATNSDKRRFLQGEAFVEKNFVSTDGVFEFEPVAGLENVFFLKVHGRTTNQYVANPGSNNFYTSSKNRAWKVEVKAARHEEKTHEYSWATQTAAGTDTTVTLTGVRAWIQESIDASTENPKVNTFDLSSLTWQNLSDASVIVSYQSKAPNKVEKDAEFNFLLTNNAGDLSVSKGTNYDRNSWILVEATENSAKEGLENMLAETFGENFDLEALTAKGNYEIGDNIGQYSKAKYDAFKALYDQALAAKEEGSKATDTEIDELTDKLPKAFAAFKQSGKPLGEGYYIVQSYRGVKETGYDGGALYDEGAVNPKGKNLKWTYKGENNITYNPKAELDYNSLKYIWKVEKDEQHPGYFFFKNMYTNRYIGDTPEKKQNQTPQMTDTPIVSYNIVANRNQPGFYSFYSPQLWKGAGSYWGYNGGDRWEFGGLHAGGDHNNVVVWDWQEAPSAFQATELTKEKVDALLSVAEQGINNDKAQKLVNEAQTAIDRGYQYMAVNEAGTRLEFANSGDITKENDPGLVTSADHLKCPMADKQEGTDLNLLLDGDANTFFHSTWHGGDDAWKGNHFLQFQLDAPQQELLLKWVKRVHDNANGGAPAKVTLWGTKSDEALDKGKENTTNAAGEEVMDYDAWKKQGWDSLAVSTFTYPYAIKVGEATKNNYAGTAYFKIPEGYKNFRLEVVSRVNGAGADGNGNRFFYGSEFRVYKGAYDVVNSLIASVPTADVDALKAAIAKVNGELKDSKATKESIAALQTAYDKFLKNYPEPTRVTTALTAAKAIEKAAEEQTENKSVGYYKSGAKNALKTVIDNVENEFNAQKAKKAPNVEQINNYIAQLDAALTEFAKQLIMPESGIYRIQSTSAEKERAGRMVTAVNSSRESNLKMRGRVESKDKKGQYEDEVGFGSVLGSYWDVQKVDTGYTLKNLYTGLYASPKGSMMTQTDTAYVFKVQFAKYPGSFNLVAREADVDGKKIYMNAEQDNLVLWNSATGQDNSSFAFVPAAEQLAQKVFDGEQGKITTYVDAKKLQIVTLPFNADFDEKEGSFYTVIGQDANNMIQLQKVADKTVLEAGVAYIYEPAASNEENKLYLYAAEGVTDYTKMVYTHTPKAAANGLVPVFEHTKLNIDNGIFNNDRTMVLLSEENDKAWANTGYFGKMPQTNKKGDKEIAAEALITALRNVVIVNGTAAKAGVYTLSGVRVNNTNNLPAGVYIVNGQKQVVK